MIVNLSLWLVAGGLGGFHPRPALRSGAYGRDDGEAAGVLRGW